MDSEQMMVETAVLTRLLDRIESLDRKVEQLTAVIEQAPGMMAMAGDIADDAYKQAAERGVDLDQRMRTALTMAERLTSPEMMTQLNSLLLMIEQAPGLTAMAVDVLDDTYRQAAESGVDIDGRLRAALDIAEKLTAPDMMANLNGLINMVNQGPGLMAMAVDVMDDAYAQAAKHGYDPENIVRQGVLVTTRMADLLESGEINNLLDSGIIAPEAVGIVSSAAEALVTSRSQSTPQVGVIGMAKALRDPDLQRALGFMILFGKEFGKNLSTAF